MISEIYKIPKYLIDPGEFNIVKSNEKFHVSPTEMPRLLYSHVIKCSNCYTYKYKESPKCILININTLHHIQDINSYSISPINNTQQNNYDKPYHVGRLNNIDLYCNDEYFGFGEIPYEGVNMILSNTYIEDYKLYLKIYNRKKKLKTIKTK